MTKKPTTKKRGPQCECFNLINETLDKGGRNMRLEAGMYMDFENGTAFNLPVISVKKRDTKKRGRLGSITPSYCPFCGKKYNL